CLHSTVARYVRAIERQVGVLESRVRQAVTEWVERLALEVAIGPSLHAVVVEGRQLLRRFVERHGKTTRRIEVSEQHVRDRAAPALARIPSHQDRGYMSLRPVDGQRRARGEYQNDRLAERLQRLQQLLLRARQAQIRTIPARETGIGD